MKAGYRESEGFPCGDARLVSDENFNIFSLDSLAHESEQETRVRVPSSETCIISWFPVNNVLV